MFNGSMTKHMLDAFMDFASGVIVMIMPYSGLMVGIIVLVILLVMMWSFVIWRVSRQSVRISSMKTGSADLRSLIVINRLA